MLKDSQTLKKVEEEDKKHLFSYSWLNYKQKIRKTLVIK